MNVAMQGSERFHTVTAVDAKDELYFIVNQNANADPLFL